MNIPSGYQTVMPYLIVKDAAKFSEFTQKVFNAEEKIRHMRDGEIIMHAEVAIGLSTIMFADSTPQFSERTTGLFVYVEDADSTFQKALDEGATSLTAPGNQPYGQKWWRC